MHIFLLGFMGTGKSSVGKALAEALAMPFYDTDQLIEVETGQKIAMIFADQGEDEFRQLETEVLKTLQSMPSGVVATGGGILLRGENRSVMEKSGQLILLSASLSTLASRLAAERIQRPLLAKENWRTVLETLYRARQPVYERIPHRVRTDGKSITEIVDDIKRNISERTP